MGVRWTFELPFRNIAYEIISERCIATCYIERLTGMKTNELVEVSQDREGWRELVVACVDLQPPD